MFALIRNVESLKDVSYVEAYGAGQFDGQNSGHDFYGTLWFPPTGWVNNCDGGRSHSYCDYRQQ
eukprot:761294-Hanusia_phi.AAC.2